MTGHIHIHQGNRLEDLASHLGRLLKVMRSSRFSLEPDIVLVNNFEMAQWLSIRIAEEQGICANIQFRLTGSFAWDLAEQFLDRTSTPLTRQGLRWLVFRCLQDIAQGHNHLEFRELRDYMLQHGEGGIYHLSLRLTDLFDRYLNYRNDMLNDWEEGRTKETDGWQPGFWKLLSERTGGQLRVAALMELVNRLKSVGQADGLPRAVYVFGISYLPPLHLDFLSAMSATTETHMFILNPCSKYWLDTVSRRKRAELKKKLDPQMVDDLFPPGNRLLSSMGYAGRSFLARLYTYPLVEGKDFFRDNCESKSRTLLSMIQDDILNLGRSGQRADGRRSVPASDESLLVHSCHSRLREVECLHDYLVRLFDSQHHLYPHHVLVMAPSMTEYAPLVRAVFGAAPEERRIPFSISDLTPCQEDPVVRTFLSIFKLPTGNFTAPEILDVLSLPPVMKRLDISPEELATIRYWIRKSGIRRGVDTLSSSTRERQNSWSFGLNRLFTSCLIDQQDMVQGYGIMPMDLPVEGSAAVLLGRLSGFFFNLVEFAEAVKNGRGHQPERWMEIFRRLVTDFISADYEHNADASALLERLSELTDAMRQASVEYVTHDVMIHALNDELGRSHPPAAYISGKVLFSSLVPMRSIPFRVICLLGMNDADFPRRPETPAFDLMARNWKPGDRIPRDEDRYLFLETLISARERLLISYVGRRERDDSVQNPSVVVSELLDYMEEEFTIRSVTSLAEHITINHPLQPFSLRYLGGHAGENRLISYASEWLPVDSRGWPLSKEEPPPFCSEEIPVSEEEMDGWKNLPPWQLSYFFSNPARFFLKKRLNIDIDLGETALDDQELFDLPRELNELFMRRLLCLDSSRVSRLKEESSKILGEVFRQAMASGLLPPPPLGNVLWEKKARKSFLPFIQKKFSVHGLPGQPVSMDRLFAEASKWTVRITGNISRTGRHGGLLEYRPEIWNSDKIAFWIRHLLFMLECPRGDMEPEGILANFKTNLVISTVPRDKAKRWLQKLIAMFIRGHRRPLCFFPAASLSFSKALNPGKGRPATQEEAIEKAVESMFRWKNPARIHDPWAGYLFRGRRNLLEQAIRQEEFVIVCRRICNPFLEYLKTGR